MITWSVSIFQSVKIPQRRVANLLKNEDKTKKKQILLIKEKKQEDIITGLPVLFVKTWPT